MFLRRFEKIIYVFVLVFIFQFHPLWAWVNGDFQSGNFTGWTITTSTNMPNAAALGGLPYAVVATPCVAPDTNGSLCPAPAICLNEVENPPPNPSPNNYSGEIWSGYGDTAHNDWIQLSQTDTISPGTPVLSFWFSAVLNGYHFQNPGGLSPSQNYDYDTYISLNVLVNGTALYSQRFSWFDNAALLVDDGFTSTANEGYGPYKHLPWTQYYYDLSGYTGNVTVQYTSYDCAGGGHYCYGFIDNAQWLTVSQIPPSYTPPPTNTPVPTSTFTFTPTISPTPTNTATITATFSPTNTATVTPTYTPTCVTYVWPDPFNPKTAVNGTLRISCMNSQTVVTIFTISGEVVRTLDYQTSPCSVPDMWGTTYCWNGRNKMGFPVVTGVYLYVVQQGNQVVQRGKFLIVNGP